MSAPLVRFVPAVILGAGVLLISGIREQYVVPPVHPMSALSFQMPGDVARDKTVDEEERRIAGMSDYVMREYVRDSTAQFSVYVGYYDRQIQGKTIHSPKNCLPGAGWDVLESTRVPFAAPGVPSGTVNRVLLGNKGARVLVYYWYQGRGRIEANEYKVKWDLLRDAALFGRTEEALVRIVVPIGMPGSAGSGAASAGSTESPDESTAAGLARQVATQLAPAVQLLLPAAPRH